MHGVTGCGKRVSVCGGEGAVGGRAGALLWGKGGCGGRVSVGCVCGWVCRWRVLWGEGDEWRER